MRDDMSAAERTAFYSSQREPQPVVAPKRVSGWWVIVGGLAVFAIGVVVGAWLF